jgi:hypothetical protein
MTDDNKVPEEVNTELKSSCQVTVQLTANSTDITEPMLELERQSFSQETEFQSGDQTTEGRKKTKQ